MSSPPAGTASPWSPAARRASRELADELAATGVRAEVVAADLDSEAGRDQLAAAIDELGLDGRDPRQQRRLRQLRASSPRDRERLLSMVRLNCEALLDLQLRYSPAMADRGRGAIINVASTAAFQPMPGHRDLRGDEVVRAQPQEATHSELAGKGVTVTALCPGPVKTEFAEVAGVGGAEEQLPGIVWTDVRQVAAAAVAGAEGGKRVVVPGLINRAGALGGQHAPRMLVLPLTKRLWRQAK